MASCERHLSQQYCPQNKLKGKKKYGRSEKKKNKCWTVAWLELRLEPQHLGAESPTSTALHHRVFSHILLSLKGSNTFLIHIGFRFVPHHWFHGTKELIGFFCSCFRTTREPTAFFCIGYLSKTRQKTGEIKMGQCFPQENKSICENSAVFEQF